jgi:hypothetical protein
MSRPNSVSLGIADAWDTYLNEHNVSVPQMIEGAIEKAVTKWLDARNDDIIEAIARKVAENARLETKTWEDAF